MECLLVRPYCRGRTLPETGSYVIYQMLGRVECKKLPKTPSFWLSYITRIALQASVRIRHFFSLGFPHTVILSLKDRDQKLYLVVRPSTSSTWKLRKVKLFSVPIALGSKTPFGNNLARTTWDFRPTRSPLFCTVSHSAFVLPKSPFSP
jgi:hypothetical protein